MKYLRFRNVYMFFVSFLVIGLMLLSDPDSALIQNLPWGATVIASLIMQLKAVIAVTLLHYTRKAMFDYIDLGDIYDRMMAKDDTVGLGLFVIGVGLFVVGFAILIAVAAF